MSKERGDDQVGRGNRGPCGGNFGQQAISYPGHYLSSTWVITWLHLGHYLRARGKAPTCNSHPETLHAVYYCRLNIGLVLQNIGLVLQNIGGYYRILDATTEYWMLLHTEYWLVEEMGLGHCEVTTRLQQTRAPTCKL